MSNFLLLHHPRSQDHNQFLIVQKHGGLLKDILYEVDGGVLKTEGGMEHESAQSKKLSLLFHLSLVIAVAVTVGVYSSYSCVQLRQGMNYDMQSVCSTRLVLRCNDETCGLH